MSGTRRERSRPSPLRNGLLMLALALPFWVFFTPYEWLSVSLYLPPVLFGLLRGIRSGRSNWKLRALTVGVYGLGFVLLIGTVILVTKAPVDALMQAAAPVLLMLLLGLIGFAAGEELAARLASRLLPGHGPGGG